MSTTVSRKSPAAPSPLLRFLPPSTADAVRRSLVGVGPVAVLAIAWASTSVRDTMAIANVALVMAS
jgi:hypothetical protein